MALWGEGDRYVGPQSLKETNDRHSLVGAAMKPNKWRWVNVGERGPNVLECHFILRSIFAFEDLEH